MGPAFLETKNSPCTVCHISVLIHVTSRQALGKVDKKVEKKKFFNFNLIGASDWLSI